MRKLLVLALLCGCGPSSSSETEGNPDATTTGQGPSTTGSSSGPGADESTSADPTTSGDTSGGGEDSTGGPACGCGEPTSVELDTKVDGTTAAEALAPLTSTTTSFQWTALEGQPEATMQIELEYTDGPISYSDPDATSCDVPPSPCLGGFSPQVVIRLTTDDGILAAGSNTTVRGIGGPDFPTAERFAFSDNDNTGTLARQTFLGQDGQPLEPSHYEGLVTWEQDGSGLSEVTLFAVLDNDAAIFIGSSAP